MSVETDPVPPLPSTTPPINKRDVREPFENNWMQWFLNLRAKVNVLNQSLVNLSGVSGTGVLVKNGASWLLRTITGTAGRISVTDGDGAAGNPTIDFVDESIQDLMATTLVAGSNVTITYNDVAGTITVAASSGSSSDPTTSIADPAYDMLWKPPTVSGVVTGASYPWSLAFESGTFSLTSINGGNTAPGVWRFSVTGSTDRVGISQGTVANIVVGGGILTIPYSFRVPTLSDAVNTFAVSIGLADNFVTATDRIYFQYTHSANSGAVRFITTSAGATTIVNSSATPVAANTWISGTIVVNAAGNQAYLYVGATLVATSNTNIPTAPMFLGSIIAKSLGATARTFDLDYLGPVQVAFTTPR